ncbi:hypothetical protein JKF63_03841 [Porcisia hertigi]|uniref:GOLD domain-containing protein n=1 Tax=Porcisia hertigi TaxID=2761500 RepID=A0A836HCI5_9TRYP|nr:hypothetical protein JKF63_03841 [Porcisia hertigi]
MRSTTLGALLLHHGRASSLSSALVLLACFAATLSVALTTEISAGEKFEITEDIDAGRELHFQFTQHPEYVFPVFITDLGTREELMRWNDLPKGSFSIPASDRSRVIAISFDNSNTIFTSKIVNFDLRTMPGAKFAEDMSSLDPIERRIWRMAETFQRLKTMQVAVRNQQKSHRDTVEQANAHILYWSIFQIFSFLTISGSQLYLLKRFLEKKTYV